MITKGASKVVTKPKQEVENSTINKGKRQTRHLDPRWQWVETSIWSENMLAALDNGVKGNKWFSLIDKIMRPQTLCIAWNKVKGNRGSAGVDNMTINKFESKCFEYLNEIQTDIHKERYRPKPIKRIHIPKGNGKTRPLGIPVIKDRVVQTAIKLVIEPIFENEFHNNSYGFRPKRGAKDALRQVDKLLKEGYTHVVDVDFQDFFDTISHKILMKEVEELISDGRVLSLIQRFLDQEILDKMKTWKPTGGTPQGAVISPLLANLYLNSLDHLINKHGIPMIRYADDFVVLTKSKEEAEHIRTKIKQWAENKGLVIHPEKSKLIDYGSGEGFDFLGYRFQNGMRLISNKSIMKIKDTIRKKTKRTNGHSMKTVIDDLNQSLKGWYNYFKHAKHTALAVVDKFTRRRLRAIYRKREKRPGQGHTYSDHKRWPNAHFAKLGLFTIVETQIKEKLLQAGSMAC